MAISSPGSTSNLDVNAIVTQLMAIERQPLTKLSTREAGYQAQLSAYGSLKSALSTFQSSVASLNSLSKFQAFRATPADSTIVTASASSSAAAGSYSVEVTDLAQSHKLKSTGFSATTDVIGTGTLSIQFGTYDSVGDTFTLNSSKSAQSIIIGASNSTLAGVRDKINTANVGVTATIVNDGGANGNRLVITSNDSGAANSLKITVTDDDGNHTNAAGLSQLVYDPLAAGTKNLSETVAAQNAALIVDGITTSKSSNVVTDVIQGVTLNLVKKNVGSPTTVTVSRDTDSVKSSVETFVRAYNDSMKTLKDLTKYDATTKRGAILLGDATTNTMKNEIRSTLTASITAWSGTYELLSDIGVQMQSDGTLKLNTTVLQTAMDTSYADIAGIFTAIGKPTDSLLKYSNATSSTKPGTYNVSITTLATQGVLNGAGVLPAAFGSPVTVDADNDTFTIKVDGTTSGSIALTQGSYTTGASLAAEIQSKINGDSALKAVGASVTVTYESASDRFTITSARYGSSSTAEFTAVDTTTAATLGFSVAAGTAGVDVAGTINGVAGYGSGQYLSGATDNDATGLQVQVLGGSLGSRGSVAYSTGYAYQLDKLVATYLKTDGLLDTRTKGINTSVENISNQRTAINQRLVLIEDRYRKQFTALDQLLGKLQATSSFLNQKLPSNRISDSG